ncbi:MAG TPA: phosphotransferase family protein [Solirubrobacteraceae bacterium]|jgi:aminoglycoside phosphotransferase (APT) family kinase protein
MSATLAPDDIVATHVEGAANDREPLLVLEPLREFLRANGLEGPSDLTAVPVGDGHSNVTFGLSTDVILRRPPRGPLPPSAHDVLREARLLSALEPTSVRTPRVLAVCADLEVIGAPFYVMERVRGDVITDQIPGPLDTPAHRAVIADELIDGLVELHATDWTTLGLEGFGKPTGYLERQLRRFNGLWEHNRTREISELDEVGAWLAENIPQSPPATIVHGDYRLGNTMFADEAPPRLAAILDWEMATIGDPLADIGYMMLHWAQAGDDKSRLAMHTVTDRPGFPTRRELVARYEERSGRWVSSMDWYVALAMWKASVFMEGNYKRAMMGTTDDPWLKTFGSGVVELARRALDVTRNGFE